MLWNDEALRKHCRETGHILFRCRAEDRIVNRKLSLEEQYAVAMKKTKNRNERKERSGLPTMVEFARGMEVMVTYNVETDLDVTNRVQGRIVDVVLDGDKPAHELQANTVSLQYMPAYLLVKWTAPEQTCCLAFRTMCCHWSR